MDYSDILFRNKQMRKAGKIAGTILSEVCSKAKVGVSLIELDELAERLCYQNDVIPAFKGYEGFPNTICVGVNDVVVHGIPDDYILKDGDIVSIDFGVIYKKVYSDTAYTVAIGKIDPEIIKFLKVTEKALYEGIKKAIPRNRVGDIGNTVQNIIEKDGYSVVREMVGHGVGYDLHEDPYIPNYGNAGTGPELYDGQTIAIEVIANQGKKEIIFLDDGWTTKTKDGSISSLFEHTIIVGEKPEILTKI